MTRRYRATDTDFEHYTTLLRARLDELGWERTDGDDWDLLWSSGVQPYPVYGRLTPQRRINHFPGVAPITYKDELAFFLARAAKAWVSPATYSMPGDYQALLDHAAARSRAVWMLKPKRLDSAEGIELIRDLSGVHHHRDAVVQEYVAEPLLFPEAPHKHGLRVYVLVTSLEPLIAYVYPNGLVKFAQEPYRLTLENLPDRRVHLTNTHLAESVNTTTVPTIDFVAYRRMLQSIGVDDRKLWHDIRRLMAEALLALAEPMLRLSRAVTNHVGSCFELLVADVLVDARHRPWLLEFNESPSLGTHADRPGELDLRRAVKEPLVRDALGLLGAEEAGFERGDRPGRLNSEMKRRGAWEPLLPSAPG